jgi:hypothetical protein
MSIYPLHLTVVLAGVASTLVILALASILFLTTMLLTMALMLRNRWDEMGGSTGSTPARRVRRPPGAEFSPQSTRNAQSTRSPETS